jgi:hypothetical protein
MVRVQIQVPRYETKTINVKFPVFLKSFVDFNGNGWLESYVRIDKSGRVEYFSVDDEGEWTYQPRSSRASGLGQYLDEDSSYDLITDTTFYAKLDEFRETLANVSRTQP